MCILPSFCIQATEFVYKIIQEPGLCLQIKRGFTSYFADRKLSELGLLFGTDVEPAGLLEVKSCVECSVRILRPELTESDI